MQLANGQLSVYENPLTLVELFDSWLEVEIMPQNIDIETKNRYTRRREVIKEYFGDIRVSHIVRSKYQKFLNSYGERCELNELGRMNANIAKAVEFAKADKIPIDDSFLKNIKLNSMKERKHPDRKFLHSQADYDRVVEYLLMFMDYRKSVVPHVLYFQFVIGLRPGEILALKWSDVDFENQEIYTHSRWSSHKHTI
ncbi:tyrosine-type recombinase/integrase, partial [Streptococcus sanguinis]